MMILTRSATLGLQRSSGDLPKYMESSFTKWNLLQAALPCFRNGAQLGIVSVGSARLSPVMNTALRFSPRPVKGQAFPPVRRVPAPKTVRRVAGPTNTVAGDAFFDRTYARHASCIRKPRWRSPMSESGKPKHPWKFGWRSVVVFVALIGAGYYLWVRVDPRTAAA